MSNNGDDGNDGSNPATPVKTLDRASELFKKNVNNISLIIDNKCDDLYYPITKPITSNSNTRLVFSMRFPSTGIHIKLKPVYYMRLTSDPKQFNIGYYLVDDFEEVTFNMCDISYPDDAVINKFIRGSFLYGCDNVRFNSCNIVLKDSFCITYPYSSSIAQMYIYNSTISCDNGTAYLAVGNRINTTVVDPDDDSTWTIWGSSDIVTFIFMTSVLSSLTNIKINKANISLINNLTGIEFNGE